MSRLPSISAAIVAALSLAACTTRSPEALAEHDPFEPSNRFWFDATQKADKYVAKPVAQAYVAVVPEPARQGLHNVLNTINQPVVFGNEVLQGSPKRAATTLGRFVVNTTVGVAGMVDVATKIGLPDDDNDGGITFGKWGLPEGPYLFLPFLGPAPPRDLLGRVADNYMQPITWIKFPGQHTLTYSILGANFIDVRAANLDTLDQIERTSVDFYATTRSLYRQHRAQQINGNQAPTPQNLPNF